MPKRPPTNPNDPPEPEPEQTAAPAQAAQAPKAVAATTGAPRRGDGGLNITDLKDMSIQKLTQIAKDMTVAGATGMRKQDLIFQILKAQTEQRGVIFSE